MSAWLWVVLAAGLVAVFVVISLRIITEYERAVHFRLGHLRGAKGPGLVLVYPIIDRIERVSLRTVALEIPHQELVTKDNVTVRVNGVTYYVVKDAVRAVMSVQNFAFATAQVAQATLLTVLRQIDLDTLLREREVISGKLRELIDAATEPWGIEVTMVEVKDVELPEQMRRAMAREAESERERRAKIIHARGEFEAAENLGQAANILEVHPAALQLRTLATLAEISVEKNSTIVFPLPFEVMRVFDGLARHFDRASDSATPTAVAPPATSRSAEVLDEPIPG
jgi:regulator of protease activity HflC (stomatin/prohibitin superfamily)